MSQFKQYEAGLSASQLAVCKLMGVTPEDFKKTLNGTQIEVGLSASQRAVCKQMGIAPEDFQKTLAAHRVWLTNQRSS
jgi:phage I-like protein